MRNIKHTNNLSNSPGYRTGNIITRNIKHHQSSPQPRYNLRTGYFIIRKIITLPNSHLNKQLTQKHPLPNRRSGYRPDLELSALYYTEI
ncbi:hypothetical protein Hanom_Chr16g01521241 [Helianthus anomalus]